MGPAQAVRGGGQWRGEVGGWAGLEAVREEQQPAGGENIPTDQGVQLQNLLLHQKPSDRALQVGGFLILVK